VSEDGFRSSSASPTATALARLRDPTGDKCGGGSGGGEDTTEFVAPELEDSQRGEKRLIS
jgi:hypothetical protein